MPGLIEFTGCNSCSLRKEWPFIDHSKMSITPPTVPSPYRVVIQGEAPGAQEDKIGRPFVGDAGKFLRENLPPTWENKVYWTNSVRCRPPKNRTPDSHEVACCSVYQIDDFEKIKPQAVLVLGDVALKHYWPDAWVTGLRGIPFPCTLPSGHTFWVMSTFHPSYVMRQDRKDYDTGQLVNTMLPVFRNDLSYFFNNLDHFANTRAQILSTTKDIVYPKTRLETLALFERLKDYHGFDLETFKLRPYQRDARLLTAGFSDGELTFAFPLDWPGSQYSWGTETLKEILLKRRNWICQSGSMEYNWSLALTDSYFHNFDDTEALARLVHKRSAIGKLAILSRVYLGIDIKKYHKFDKGNLLKHPIEEVLEYNAYDAWATKLIYHRLVERASDVDLDNYYRIIDAIKSTVAMEELGLNADLDSSEELYKQYFGEMAVIESKARQVPEVIEFERREARRIKLSEPETIGHVLVNYCGLDLPSTPKEKQYSTTEKDLEPFLTKHPLVQIVLDYRDVAKLTSTYVEPFLNGKLFGADGVIHPQYTVVHTATYRLSSEFPNIQNFPKRAHKEARRQIRASEGHVFAAWDYGQLEGRVIAMFSQDRNLIRSFIEEEDIHWKWLYRIIDLYPEYMDRLARVSGESDEKKVLKSGRTIIKTDFVFACFYGAKANSLANRTGLPLHIAERVTGEFWDLYPDAQKWTNGQFQLYQECGFVSSLTGRERNEVLPGNEPTNTPCQGSAAELVLEAQNALFYKAITEDLYFMPRINIHDDLIFELRDDNTLGDYIDNIGQEVVKPRFPFVTVPLISECRVGNNWADLEPITEFRGPYFEYSKAANA